MAQIENLTALIRAESFKFWRKLPRYLQIKLPLEDIEQEVWYEYAKCEKRRAEGKFDETRTQFSTYFTSAMRGVFAQLIIENEAQKRSWRKESIISDVVEEDQDLPFMKRWHLPSEFDRTELRMTIVSIMGKLSEDARAVLQLILNVADGSLNLEDGGKHRNKDLSLRDLTQVLGLTSNRVKSAVQECRQHLMPLL